MSFTSTTLSPAEHFMLNNNSDLLFNDSSHVTYEYQQSTARQRSFDIGFYMKVRFIFSWISVFVILIGLVGNFISFIVLVSSRMRIATNVFLASLCVSGFIALLGLLINSVIYEILAYHGMIEILRTLWYFYPYIYPLITTFQFCCILLTVCVSVNQFVCIYSSKLKSRSKKTQREECRTAFIIVLVMYLISIVYCIPYWLKFKYTEAKGLHETELGQNPLFKKLVHFWLYLPIAYIIPFSILIVTNTYLIGTLMLARKRRQRLTGGNGNSNSNPSSLQKPKRSSTVKTNQYFETESLTKNPPSVNVVEDATVALAAVKNEKKIIFPQNEMNKPPTANTLRPPNSYATYNGLNNSKEGAEAMQPPARSSLSNSSKQMKAVHNKSSGSISITIMLIAVVIFFFICQFPVLILHIIQSMFCTRPGSGCELSGMYNYAIVVSKFLLICNLSFNFACYCLFNEKFRDVFAEKFCLRKSGSTTNALIKTIK